MVKIIYLFLKLFELIIFIVCGRKMAQCNSSKLYWKYSIFPILIYSVVEGLRFGRFIDWNLYYFRYKQLGVNASSLDYEPLFRYICHILYRANIPYYGFIFLQCMFFVFSAIVLLKNFKKSCYWALPLILICSTSNEMFIRWFLAFSFILLSINSFLNNKNVYTCVFVGCGILCHSGIIVIALLIFILVLFRHFAIPSKIAIVLLFLSTFVLSLENVMFITQIMSYIATFLTFDYSMAKYIDQADLILSGAWGNVGVMERSLIKNIGAFLAYTPVILWGKQYMQEYKYGNVFYNLFIIGAIGAPLFTVEIFDRIFAACLFFFCIVGGCYYSNIFNARKRTYILLISIIGLLFAIAPHIWDAINRDANEALFIWDSHGRNYLQI